MKKIIILISISLVFFMACAGNEGEIIKNSDSVTSNEGEITSNSGSAEDFKISKEILKAKYLDIYNCGNGENKNIEYETTKEYIYSENGELVDTKYSTKGTVYYYDKFIGSDDANIIGERPVTEEDEKIFEWHNTQFYLDNFEEFIDYLKNRSNLPEEDGKVTKDDKGRVIKIEYDDSGYYFTYDDQDRVIKVTWGGGLSGYSETYYKYDDIGLLVEIFEMSRNDTRDGMDYTVTLEYIEK